MGYMRRWDINNNNGFWSTPFEHERIFLKSFFHHNEACVKRKGVTTFRTSNAGSFHAINHDACASL